MAQCLGHWLQAWATGDWTHPCQKAGWCSFTPCCVPQHTGTHLLHTPLFCELRKLSTAVCVGKCYSFSTGEAETEQDCPKFKATVRTCLQQTNKHTENYR